MPSQSLSNRSTATSLPSTVDMRGQTISEKILSRTPGKRCCVGDFAFCGVDSALGTEGLTQLAIHYFDATGTLVVSQPDWRVFALDDDVPEPLPKAAALHARIREFASRHGMLLCGVALGIGHQIMVEHGHVLPCTLSFVADSHAVISGALYSFASLPRRGAV
jgi:3-isopropylmalate/(R)-2-methylmalate dehydratase large subunit